MLYRDLEKMLPWLLLLVVAMAVISWILSLFGIEWPPPA